jgi:hypothetical protein
MSSVRIQHDVYAQVLVNHVYDADVLPRIKANTGKLYLSNIPDERNLFF